MQGVRERKAGALAWALALALLASLAAVPGARGAFDCGATMNRCQVQVDNSGRVWFPSSELLTEDAVGDGSGRGGVIQIFVRDGDTTRLLKGPDGNPIPRSEKYRSSGILQGLTPDGERVYVSTEASLTADDTDVPFAPLSVDGYEVRDGAYTLITTGPQERPTADPFGCCGGSIVWASDDGSNVFFVTNAAMTADDLDGSRDVYERAGGVTRLASSGPAEVLPDPNYSERAADAEFLGASADGKTAYFATWQQLTADDTEKTTSDIYAWRDGVTWRVTRTVKYPEGPGRPFEAFSPISFVGSSEDGSIFYMANSPQAPEDTNASSDVYRTGPDGSTRALTAGLPPPAPGPGSAPLFAVDVSYDGSRLFLTTPRALLPEDTDDDPDIYLMETATAALRLISVGAAARPAKEAELMLSGTSRDGRRAFFSTWERLTDEDTDDVVDFYEWSDDGRVSLATPAADGRQVGPFFKGISPNGRFLVFETFEELVPGDGDAETDLYLVDMGTGTRSGAFASAAGAARGKRKSKGKGRKRPTRRIRLVSAEAIPPRMTIAPGGTLGPRGASLRVRCPRAESSGPCRGKARLLDRRTRRTLATGRFRVAPGRAVRVRLTGSGLAQRKAPLVALAKVRAADLLGNARTVAARVRLRGVR